MLLLKNLKTCRTNRQLFLVDKELSSYLKKTIYSVTKNYKGIPETIDGLYYEFLFEVPTHIKTFRGEDIKFPSYLAMKCRNFTSNKCRGFESKKHKVMNDYVSLNTNENFKEPSVLPISDSVTGHGVDLTVLSPIELEVYKLHFIEGIGIDKVASKLKTTRYKVEQYIKSASIKVNKTL